MKKQEYESHQHRVQLKDEGLTGAKIELIEVSSSAGCREYKGVRGQQLEFNSIKNGFFGINQIRMQVFNKAVTCVLVHALET